MPTESVCLLKESRDSKVKRPVSLLGYSSPVLFSWSLRAVLSPSTQVTPPLSCRDDELVSFLFWLLDFDLSLEKTYTDSTVSSYIRCVRVRTVTI